MRVCCSDPGVAARVARVADRMAVAREVAALKEEIRSIPGYDGYYASNRGVILSAKRGETRPMKPDAGEQGHQRVQLHREGSGDRGDRLLVHRLILETFVGPAPTPDAQGCHRDGDATNNAVPNLRWGTQAENWGDRKRHGNGQSWARLTLQEVEDIKGFRKAGMTAANVAAKFGISDTQVRNIERGLQWAEASEWPLRNVWLGTSVENQRFADERIPLLLQTLAAVRFISAEPLLGPLNLKRHVQPRPGATLDGILSMEWIEILDWVIVGGESGNGPNIRPFDLSWARSIVRQCKAAGVACFVKQLGAVPWVKTPNHHGPGVDTPPYNMRRQLKDRRGGDPDEWPNDLRVREFPATIRTTR
jgi:hypothetical protein